MFAGKVEHRQSGLIFPGGNGEALAACVAELMESPALYERLSANAIAAWQRLQCPVKWREMLRSWLRGSDEARQSLLSHSLASPIDSSDVGSARAVLRSPHRPARATSRPGTLRASERESRGGNEYRAGGAGTFASFPGVDGKLTVFF